MVLNLRINIILRCLKDLFFIVFIKITIKDQRINISQVRVFFEAESNFRFSIKLLITCHTNFNVSFHHKKSIVQNVALRDLMLNQEIFTTFDGFFLKIFTISNKQMMFLFSYFDRKVLIHRFENILSWF
jgi:hypothetical protein